MLSALNRSTQGGAGRAQSCSSEMSELSDWALVDADFDTREEAKDLPMSKEKYPAKQHVRSVSKYLPGTRGLIYLVGRDSSSYEDSDQPIPFRQRRYFYYASGVNFSGCIVTYDRHLDRLFAWIQPPNTGSNVIFNGSNPTVEEVQEKCNFDRVFLVSKLDAYLERYVKVRAGRIFALHSSQAPKLQLPTPSPFYDYTFPVTEEPWDHNKLFDNESLKPAMDAARAIKSAYEIQMIRKASDITAKAHTEVLKAIKSLKNEAEVEAIFVGTCLANQAKQQAYGVIAGSGEKASTLHYIANNEPLKGRQLLCLDAGCEWECYASDVTRTFPISGTFSKEGKQIYDIVAKMQEECINLVKAGADYRNIHRHAHKVAIQGLKKLGLLKGTFEDLYQSGVSVAFFPHGLGHYLGLECHDFGAGGYLLFAFDTKPTNWIEALHELNYHTDPRPASILKPNQVITVEPGIYFSRYALEEVYLKDEKYAKFINRDLLEKYYPVGGVRIEDDLLVTEHGFENLTTALKGREALDIINGV